MPGVIGSVGLVGLVSVYCDWVRWKVWSVTSVSVWQHVKLSKQIGPLDALARCWEVKQAGNQPTKESSRFGFDSCFHRGSCSKCSHTSDLKTGTPVATLPGTWC